MFINKLQPDEIEICINKDELDKAILSFEQPIINGFNHCMAVFRMKKDVIMLGENQAVFSDLYERAHPTNDALDWGRGQRVAIRNKFVNNRLQPINF